MQNAKYERRKFRRSFLRGKPVLKIDKKFPTAGRTTHPEGSRTVLLLCGAGAYVPGVAWCTLTSLI